MLLTMNAQIIKEDDFMKRKIRRGVFETNSSSVHSITMCSEDEYDKWGKGELIYDKYEGKLIQLEDKDPEDEETERYLSIDEYVGYYEIEKNYEIFDERYKMPDGQEVIAFGYYGICPIRRKYENFRKIQEW